MLLFSLVDFTEAFMLLPVLYNYVDCRMPVERDTFT